MPVEIALGFRVKSGFAVAVVLSGTARAPVALARRIVALSDPGVEKTRQPYHDGFGTAQEDANEIARLSRIIQRCARGSVDEMATAMEARLAHPTSVPDHFREQVSTQYSHHRLIADMASLYDQLLETKSRRLAASHASRASLTNGVTA